MYPLESDLIDEIADDGFEDREHAAAAARAAISAVAECLTHDEARRLAPAVPRELRVELAAAHRSSRKTADEIIELVRSREHVSAGRAREELQIVCAALGRRLSVDDRQAIVHALPDDIAADFELGRREPPSTERPFSSSANGHTLSSGRPGSLHPLSEAKPQR